MADFSHSSEPLLEIDGSPAPDKLMEDLQQIIVEENVSLPGMFTLVFQNSALPGQEEAEIWEHAKLFDFGKSIKIGFTSSVTASEDFSEQEKGTILAGEITAIETHFTPGSQAPIVIRGYDPSHRLHRGRFNRSFQNMTDSDVVKKIAGEVGISAGTIDNSGAPHDYIFQQNQTNMEFLRSRAARCGFELFVKDAKLNFRKPKGDDSIELTWLKDLSSFQVRVSSAEQVSSVEVRGWDYQQKKPFVATKSSDQLITATDYGDGKKTSNVFKEKPSDPKMTVVDQPVFTQKEADTIAQALFNELSGEFVQADAKAEGNPKIRPGQVVKLSKMGKYSGKYYVTEARHRFSERVYTTEFSIRGLRGGDLLSVLAPPARPKVGQTLLVGVVADNKDPEGWGRVRVKCPTLTEEHESNWARVVGAGAGSERGFDCLPEIDDEVLVGFEHGDIHRPYILGGVWNGQDAPPEPVDNSVADGKVRLRTFKTRTGHSLQFIEEDKGSSKKGIQVISVYGHEIHLNDSEKVIKIKTNGGHQLTLDDQSKKIEMKSTGTIAIEAPQKIDLKVGQSTIAMTPSGVEISSMNSTMKGTAQAKVEGALVDVIAQGVAKIKAATLMLG
ncbi:VgrG-related protein [Leptothoe spongobia]|uniref:VgrG-related protein n=1 Tax=Leptothoe spongobia TAU-MAC 1115 TaxID=1967444 RepID=A0A947DIM4_9CYAN|nr:VgrG-related protein [Leptothoe spongobia]MBT9316671.1 VgrG-related protein [Leptothoe spongobia TAU-MAC 1115]